MNWTNAARNAGTLLNVNMPSQESGHPPEIVISRQAKCYVKDNFQKRIDPRNRTYYWLDSEELFLMEGGDTGVDTDVEAVKKGKISITPIRCDLTDPQSIHLLQTWPLFRP